MRFSNFIKLLSFCVKFLESSRFSRRDAVHQKRFSKFHLLSPDSVRRQNRPNKIEFQAESAAYSVPVNCR